MELAQIRERIPDTFARYLRSGVTSVVDVGGPFWNFEVRKLSKETSVGPRVAVAGPLISTYEPEALATEDPAIIRVHSIDEARALVRRQAADDPDLIKIWFIVFADEKPQDHLPLIEATIDESHKHGIRVALHATQLETARAAVKAGADVLVHSVVDKEVDEDFVRLLKENGVIYTTTLGVFESYREVLTQQVGLTAPEHEVANPYVVSTLFDLRELPAEDIPQRVLEGIRNPRPISQNPVALRNLKTLQDAGVTIAAGTDAGNIGTLHGPAIFREFELMEKAGLSPMEILTSATINGARVMGRAGELGTIEESKLADMVLLNSDPLIDIRNTADIHLIVKGGEVYAPQQIIKKTTEDIVQHQVNAYNCRDIEAFLATYSPDIEIFYHPDSLLYSGFGEMRSVYEPLFEDATNLHVEILNRIVLRNFVMDRESVTGLPDDQVVHAITTYEVREGRIRRVWFIME